MIRSVACVSRSPVLHRFFSAQTKLPILGFVGLGHMGSKMVTNFSKDGNPLLIFDPNADNQRKLQSLPNVESASSAEDVASRADIVFTMLPNDEVVQSVSQQLFSGLKQRKQGSFVHISCSTTSPNMSRFLEKKHHEIGLEFIAAPVFARPDGLLKREATFMVSGRSPAREVAAKYLSNLGRIEDMGEDVGAANVVKLCGNFLIATSIESIGEAMALAEKSGVDRERVMNLLSSSIFDCLIYRGYGQRVSKRDHRPGGFSLELGLKDVTLVNKAARDASVPMPFLSTLVDRYTSAKAKGRSSFDWSAIGLNIAEDAGIDVKADVERTMKDVKENNQY